MIPYRAAGCFSRLPARRVLARQCGCLDPWAVRRSRDAEMQERTMIRKPIHLTTGDPATAAEAAYRILSRLGCTTEDGGVFDDDLEIITGIISDLVERLGGKNEPD